MAMLNGVRHHARFFTALACGMAAFGAGHWLGMPWPEPVLMGGDVFYGSFLLLCLVLACRSLDLKKRAKQEDEGIGVVILITLATIGYFCVAVFEVLSHKQGDMDVAALVFAGTGALLGWFGLV